MIRIEPFEMQHFFMVEGREARFNESHEWLAWLYYNRSFFADGKRSAFTCFDDDRVIGCAGMMIFAKVGDLWMHISNEMVKRPIWFHKTVKAFFDAVRELSGVNRVETSIDETKIGNCDWLERAFGMTVESRVRKFGPNGETFLRYAWIKED